MTSIFPDRFVLLLVPNVFFPLSFFFLLFFERRNLERKLNSCFAYNTMTTRVRSNNWKDFTLRSFRRRVRRRRIAPRFLGTSPPAAITITKNGNFAALQCKTRANFPPQCYSAGAAVPSYIRRWGGLTYKLVNNSVHWFTIYIALALALNPLTMIVLFNAMNNSLPESCVYYAVDIKRTGYSHRMVISSHLFVWEFSS